MAKLFCDKQKRIIVYNPVYKKVVNWLHHYRYNCSQQSIIYLSFAVGAPGNTIAFSDDFTSTELD